jgi:predicted MFS family arabinose efflux permease
MMGVWGSYMPLATALVLLLGPLVLVSLGWRIWWWLLAGLTLLMAVVLLRAVPAARQAPPSSSPTPWMARIRLTLAAPGPWLVAVCFALYSGQWLAVIGFLPAIGSQAGVPAAALGAMTALAAAVNMAGNLAAGRLQQRGVQPQTLLLTGFAVMGAAALAAFHGGAGQGLPPLARYAAVLMFSGVGGMIPATLFTLAVRVAPSEGTLASTVGWVQQWSSLGQMLGPPAVAWVASRYGSWQYTGWVTGACSVAGLALVPALLKPLRR